LEHDTIANFADDTALIAVGEKHEDTETSLQTTILKNITVRTRKWQIKLNGTETVHINTNKRHDTPIPYADTAKYLGMTLDTKL